jgi:succinate-semialdehyde dehydrogenase / glutarate-semialdehyde dehydrogenase
MSTDLATINPFTLKEINRFQVDDVLAIERKLSLSYEAFAEWHVAPLVKRLQVIREIGETLLTNKTHLASLASLEMGKPLQEALSEVEKCAHLCRFYFDHAEKWLQPEVVQTAAKESFRSYEALGTILGIMPWNFPYWQVCRFAIPTLCAGNTVVIKHAMNTLGCAEALFQCMTTPNLPRGVFQNIVVDHEAVQDIIKDSRIRGVSLTGSTRAGKAVASTAGSVIKPVVLELGGSDPYIIVGDADIDDVIDKLGTARLMNCGQSCISPKRMIVDQRIYKAFVEALVEQFRKYKVDDPTKLDTKLGPLARPDLRDSLADQVQRSIDGGAKLLLGGKPLDECGSAYFPTVLSDVYPGQAAFDEELFGPVAAVTPFQNIEMAIKLANQSIYGLGGGVFSTDLDLARGISRKLQCGFTAINDFVRSDPRLPFGGIKESGIGRELSREGVQAFTNIKTVFIR